VPLPWVLLLYIEIDVEIVAVLVALGAMEGLLSEMLTLLLLT